MNRYIKKIIGFLFFLILVMILIWLYFPAFGKISLSKGFDDKDNKTEDSTYIQNAYAPEANQWIEFKIPSSAKLIKVTSNVPYYYDSNEKSYPYNIVYEIFDKSGNLLYSNLYSHNGKVRLYKKRGSNRILSEPFLIDGNCYLSRNCEIIIPVNHFKGPSLLKIRWNSPNQLSENVLIRAAKYSEKSESVDESQWLRISEDKRKEIAQSSIFPLADIKKEEIQNILSKKWKLLSALDQSEKIVPEYRIGKLPLFKLKSFHIPEKKKRPKLSTLREIKSEIFKLYLESAGGIFKIPSLKNTRKAEALFEDLFNQKEVTPQMEETFKKLGFSLKEIKRTNNLYIVISELEDHKEGKGFYIFCRNAKIKKCALEMPHRFFDDKTGIIGLKMLFTGNFSAGAWNTVHRYQTPNNMPGSSDMAHNRRSYFHAFSKAFLKSSEAGSIVFQLHGFNEGKHNIGADMPCAILSEGINEPSKKFLAVCKIIGSILQLPVLIHPLDSKVEELSAQENVTATSFAKSQSNKIFVHFEMNRQLRNKFVSDKDFLGRFSTALNEETGRLNE